MDYTFNMHSEKVPLLPSLHGKSSDSPPASNSTFDYQTNQTNEQSNGNSPEEAVNVISTYDDVLPYLGDIGVWQGVTVLLLGVLAADGGILVLLQNFTALEPKAFRCLISSCDSSNSSYSATATGSNSNISGVATGSNTSYSDVA